jgi:DNA repair exonuclease SbcCD ATPase subunit
MSYGATWTEVEFKNGIATYVIGENHDNNTHNGCGKTAILNCITYAIYNKPFKNINLTRLINATNNVKSTLMEVEYYFKKGEDQYLIHRTRGESTGATLYKNGIDISPDSINEIDKMVEDLYGFSYELFTKIIVFAGSSTPFLELPVSQQRAQIEELFNISILSEKAVKLKKLIATTESDIKVEEALLKEKENSNKLQQKQINDLEQKVLLWESINKNEITKLSNRLLEVQDIDFEKEQALLEVQKELQTKILKQKNEEAATLKILNEYSKNHIKFQKEIDHLIEDKCPYCLQGMADAPQKLLLLEDEQKSEYQDFLLIQHDYIEKIDLRKLDDASLLEVSKEIKYSNLPLLLATKNDFNNLEIKLEELKIAVNPHFDTYETLISGSISELNYNRLDKLKSRHEHQKFLLKLLTDKNSFIRKKIIARTIPFLNLQMNKYSTRLGLPHLINFDDDMSCTVSEFGRELDFGNLSGGEVKRLNLGMSLAFRDVLSRLHSHINLLFVDEIDASLCFSGVDNVISLLKEKTVEDELSTFIIMHRDVKDKFENHLIIHKKLGFSEIINH